MDNIEISLLNYKFKFRQLHWREEFSIKFEPKKDRLRTILASALVEVSGLQVRSLEDATKILEAIPGTVIYRLFIIYKGSLPQSRVFTTMGLYKAPEPNRFIKKIEEAEVEQEQVADRVGREMEQRFGRKELQEQREMEQLMWKNSRGRGAVRATDEDAPAPPPPAPRTDDKKGLGTRPPNKLNHPTQPTAPPVNIGSHRKENV